MRIKTLLTLAIGGALAIPSFAASIDLGINGAAMVGVTTIDFSNYPTNTTFATPPAYGAFQVGALPTPGDLFTANGVTSGEMGQIQSLSMALEPVRAAQFDTPYMNTPFMTFNTGGSNLQLFLTAVLQGSLAPGSPYTITPGPNGPTVQFAIDGFVLNTTNNTRTPYTGTFSQTLNGSPNDPATLIGTLPIFTTFSGTFSLQPVTPAIPEPASLMLMGMGLLGAGIIARRKIRS